MCLPSCVQVRICCCICLSEFFCPSGSLQLPVAGLILFGFLLVSLGFMVGASVLGILVILSLATCCRAYHLHQFAEQLSPHTVRVSYVGHANDASSPKPAAVLNTRLHQ